MEWIILGITITLGYIGWNERDKSMINKKLNDRFTKAEVEHFIDLKNKPIEVVQREASEDIKECNRKLDKLEDLIRSLKD